MITYVSRMTHAKLSMFKWRQFDHPPSRPDIMHCDFHRFGSLKKHLKERSTSTRTTNSRTLCRTGSPNSDRNSVSQE
ncbi:hypothetical protein TNCV_1751191 [Trichonephila clavipes]|nr:hypothetical protein TNCV_1751191 [Trichonephila clavipes]